ncbi:MAG: hypothetical protein DM484_20200 [Candidatus Methylumidiphilus alinenensis]|uniref:Uncharacterized protein n=1 Tax=Candidatus Methylumidiphilus alinenensis TaxID=2202197 RepID=A0A2W4SPX1_9GAMM|nr:MAG: hypothetical protein DM484_20200 [Candidatus Methylumidiphilus alinenensis]
MEMLLLQLQLHLFLHLIQLLSQGALAHSMMVHQQHTHQAQTVLVFTTVHSLRLQTLFQVVRQL